MEWCHPCNFFVQKERNEILCNKANNFDENVTTRNVHLFQHVMSILLESRACQ